MFGKLSIRNLIPGAFFGAAAAIALTQILSFLLGLVSFHIPALLLGFLGLCVFCFSTSVATAVFSTFDLLGFGPLDAFKPSRFTSKTGVITGIAAAFFASFGATLGFILLSLVQLAGIKLYFVIAVLWVYTFFVSSRVFGVFLGASSVVRTLKQEMKNNSSDTLNDGPTDDPTKK